MCPSLRLCNKHIKLRSRRKFRLDTSLRLCNTLKLCGNRRKLPGKDLISELPDVILVSVLSLLTTKEAGRTSVLSKRWRHVWTYVPRLIFDATEILARCEFDFVTQSMERIWYVHCVNQVVSSHKAPTVDEFRLRFFLFEGYEESIDKWVRFAAEKRIKRLEFNFGSNGGSGSKHLYNFPSLYFWNSLTTFKLDFVNVTGEVLESLIHNCKALEFLSVIGSNVLVALKVVSPSVKSLIIRKCYGLKNLEIFAPNLVSLDYSGSRLCRPLISTLKLAELSVIGKIGIPHLISNVSHQIEVLKLIVGDIKLASKAFPECKRLKTLDVQYDPECEEDLFCARLLIKACPFLHKLVIQLDLSDLSKYGSKWEVEEHWHHNHLKTVQIVGYEGSASRFAKYLIKNVVSLEKLIIDTQPPFEFRTPGEPVVNKKITRAKNQAAKLHNNLKPWTELEIC